VSKRTTHEEGVGAAVVVELAALTNAAQLPAAVLAAVGEPELHLGRTEAPDPITRLLAALDGRDAILVLDSCEHLVADVAALAEALLTARPRVRVLATSRVPGEVVVLPDPVGPEQPENGPGPGDEVDAVEGGGRAEPLDQPLDADRSVHAAESAWAR
jgi:hypothetical protein